MEAPSSRRQLAWIGGGLAAVVVLTLVVLAVRSPAEFEPGSPEAVVQDYLQAVLAGDERTAATFFAEDSNCTRDDFDHRDRTSNVRITLIDSEVFADDEATVEVRIRFDEGALDTLSSYDLDETFFLVREAGDWRITNSPWPLFFCEEEP